MNYLVEMKIPPAASVPTREEGIAFTERFVLPTLDAGERLVADRRIRAGGPILGAMGFAFVANAETPQELEEIVAALPIWPRAQTAVVPLGTFADRHAAVKKRLAMVKAAVAPGVSARSLSETDALQRP